MKRVPSLVFGLSVLLLALRPSEASAFSALQSWSAVVSSGHVVVTTADRHLLVLDAATGNLVGEATDPQIGAPVGFAVNAALVEYGSGLASFSLEGQLRWRRELDTCTIPQVRGDSILICDQRDHAVLVIDARTGDTRWSRKTPDIKPPVWGGDSRVLTLVTDKITALSVATGAELWTLDLPRGDWRAIGTGDFVALTSSKELRWLSLTDGSPAAESSVAPKGRFFGENDGALFFRNDRDIGSLLVVQAKPPRDAEAGRCVGRWMSPLVFDSAAVQKCVEKKVKSEVCSLRKVSSPAWVVADERCLNIVGSTPEAVVLMGPKLLTAISLKDARTVWQRTISAK